MATYLLLDARGHEIERSEDYDRLLRRLGYLPQAIELARLDGDRQVVLRHRGARAREQAVIAARPRPARTRWSGQG